MHLKIAFLGEKKTGRSVCFIMLYAISEVGANLFHALFSNTVLEAPSLSPSSSLSPSNLKSSRYIDTLFRNLGCVMKLIV